MYFFAYVILLSVVVSHAAAFDQPQIFGLPVHLNVWMCVAPPTSYRGCKCEQGRVIGLGINPRDKFGMYVP